MNRPAARDAIEAALNAEKAASLGHAGRLVERALARLEAGEDDHERLIDAAADAVWGFLVQRELCGLHDRERVIAHYRIPPAVLARMGVARRQGGRK